jgi:hypothetical protein
MGRLSRGLNVGGLNLKASLRTIVYLWLLSKDVPIWPVFSVPVQHYLLFRGLFIYIIVNLDLYLDTKLNELPL